MVILAQRGFGKGGARGGTWERLGLAPHRAVVVACVIACLSAAALGTWGVGAPQGHDGPASEASAVDPVPAAGSGSTEAPRAEDDADTRTEAVLVHVDGAVARPGLVELRMQRPRANDAVEAAGGLLEDADCTDLNLATEVRDGEKVHVPREGEESGRVSGPGRQVVDPAGGAAFEGLVNLNVADAATLQTLPGVGASTARAIVEDREAHGPFASVDDLARVSGIGQKKLEKIRSHACV